ncbi:nuclear transport factor 2 family protein [Herbidospora mongoliensis]|uniref:nuclear transport factor 2 family protein n=1 Tax=Herbidospora mongoliensis TaxID=688067 RepID=UPI00082F019B|nr:nuclear transport factor 2 family protein [Herbidospora mongoliensis]
MNTREIALRFARTWQTGWATHDVGLLVSLYAPDIVHRSMPFREPHRGLAALREYLTWSFSEEIVLNVKFGEPLVDGDTAAIEFSVRAEEGHLAGCVFVRFDENGLAVETRDYWHMTDNPEYVQKSGVTDHPGYA